MRRLAREMLAGGVAEALMDCLLFPIDTFKNRRQAKGPLAAGNVFRGIVPVAASALPSGACFLGTKFAVEMLVHRLSRRATHGAEVTMLASAIADVAYWLVRFPFETVKKRVQVGRDSSAVAALRRMVREGQTRPAALYTGWRTVLWRDVPYDALEFGLYEWIRRTWTALGNGAHAGFGCTFSGALSAMCAAILTTPLDCTRTRLITLVPGVGPAYCGVVDCLRRTFREEGVASLFAGVLERAVLSGLGGAIWFTIYERIREGHGPEPIIPGLDSPAGAQRGLH